MIKIENVVNQSCSIIQYSERKTIFKMTPNSENTKFLMILTQTNP